MNLRRAVLGSSLTVVLVAGAGVASGASSSPDAGRYAGKAVKGTKIAFVVKVMDNCPTGNGKFKRALCLTWTPGISMPVVCEYWNDADPKHQRKDEGRAVPLSAAVSAKGKVDLKAKSSGPGYSDATRLTATLRDGKATGKVTYTARGRSSIVSKDCTGKLEFTAKRR